MSQNVHEPLSTFSNDSAWIDINTNLLSLETQIDTQFKKLQEEFNIARENNKNINCLKDRLIFIEQFYIKRTGIETDIECQLNRIAFNISILKKSIDGLVKDMKVVKQHINHKRQWFGGHCFCGKNT